MEKDIISYQVSSDPIDLSKNVEGKAKFNFYATLTPTGDSCTFLRLIFYNEETDKITVLKYEEFEADAIWGIVIKPLLNGRG